MRVIIGLRYNVVFSVKRGKRGERGEEREGGEGLLRVSKGEVHPRRQGLALESGERLGRDHAPVSFIGIELLLKCLKLVLLGACGDAPS